MLTQEERGNINRPITSNEIQSIIIKKLQINKCSGLDDYTCEFYHTFKEELRSVLKLFQKIKKEEMISVFEASITQYQNQTKILPKNIGQYH